MCFRVNAKWLPATSRWDDLIFLIFRRLREASREDAFQREFAHEQAQEGFKFVGDHRVTGLRAQTSEGRKLESLISGGYDERRLEYEIAPNAQYKEAM